MGLTEAVATWASGLAYSSLPDAVRSRLGDLVLDWLGCALGGASDEVYLTLADVVRRDGLGGTADRRATVLGTGETAGPPQAALLNGAAGHVLEFDDIYPVGTFHPATVVVPAALAAAEAAAADGPRFLAGVAAGYEVGDRLAAAAGPDHYRYWHTTATVGTVAAAVAAGRVLGLDPAAMSDALGSAGTMAAGLWEFNRSGAMSKVLHAGRAASAGVLAAELARAGFTGARTILEGPQGLLTATAGGPAVTRLEELARSLGRHWTIGEIMLKAYPCCGHTHTAVEAALAARRRMAAGTDIERVTVRTNSVAVATASHRRPTSPREARFSLSYCVALALVRGRVTLDDFRPENLGDPAVAALEQRVVVTADADLDAAFPGERTAVVEVAAADGASWRAEARRRKGEPANPLTPEDVRMKLTGLLGPAGARDDPVRRLQDAVRALPGVADIRGWVKEVTGR